MKYKIEISLRDGVKDIAAESIFKTANANDMLGNGKLQSLRMGKWFVVECDDDYDIEVLCANLLANSVIENYSITEL
jgi:phosphoribosylformylglycinamidine (FGAM) synthase PurS component